MEINIPFLFKLKAIKLKKKNSSRENMNSKRTSINFKLIPRPERLKGYGWQRLFFLSLIIYTFPSLLLYVFFHKPAISINEFIIITILSVLIQIMASYIGFRIVIWFYQGGNTLKKILIFLFVLLIVFPIVVGLFSAIFFALFLPKS